MSPRVRPSPVDLTRPAVLVHVDDRSAVLRCRSPSCLCAARVSTSLRAVSVGSERRSSRVFGWQKQRSPGRDRSRLCKNASFRVSLASDSREDRMRRFVEGTDRAQATLFPECLEDWICEDNPVRAIDVFVDELDLAELGFGGVDPEATGRPSYHPSVPLKLYIYGYLNRVQSSRRL